MDNVINLFSRRSPAKSGQQLRGGESPQQLRGGESSQQLRGGESSQQSSSAAVLNPGSFSDVTERNRVNQQRLRKEREQANKNVLKSYRIK